MLSRRRLIGLGLAGATLSGCTRIARGLDGDRLPADLTLPAGDVHPTVRLLDRAGFGPRPGEVAEVERTGREAWLESQLHPDDNEPSGLKFQLSRLDVSNIDGMELRDMPENEMLRQMSQAAILRAIYSPWQLRERMVDFWTNHFNIYARKGLAAYRKPNDDLHVIRANALLTFPNLLRASAHSPAMLAFLDNRQNMRGVANENYARELMELHTLGVHGGYTQYDVQEVARCFTGWTVEDGFLQHRGAFKFDPERHDRGEKTVLGVKIPAEGGQNDGEHVLEILAHHPACARFIAQKMVRHFLGGANEAWVSKLAKIYTETGGDIPSMLRPLLLSQEALEGDPVSKRPLDFVVSALRALDADTDGGRQIQDHLVAMGQPLFEWPMPDGYPDKTSAWTGSLLARWNFALKLASNQLEGSTVDLKHLASRIGQGGDADKMVAVVLPGRDLAHIQEAAKGAELSQFAALSLCAPEFQWR